MTRNLTAFIASAIFLGSSCSSQGLYPLQIGNRWDYGYLDMGHFIYEYSERIVGDTLMPDGFTYAIRTYLTSGSPTFLRQSGDTVFVYESAGDRILYDFATADGDTIAVRYVPGDTIVTIVNVSQGQLFNTTKKMWTFTSRPFHSTNEGWVVIADSIGRSYAFAEGGNNEYLIGAIINGVQYGTITSLQVELKPISARLHLFQNFPNPFNPSTTIAYNLPDHSVVTIRFYDALGRLVRTTEIGPQESGLHHISFDGNGLSSGTYFYRLVAKSTKEGDAPRGRTLVGRMLLVK